MHALEVLVDGYEMGLDNLFMSDSVLLPHVRATDATGF